MNNQLTARQSSAHRQSISTSRQAISTSRQSISTSRQVSSLFAPQAQAAPPQPSTVHPHPLSYLQFSTQSAIKYERTSSMNMRLMPRDRLPWWFLVCAGLENVITLCSEGGERPTCPSTGQNHSQMGPEWSNGLAIIMVEYVAIPIGQKHAWTVKCCCVIFQFGPCQLSYVSRPLGFQAPVLTAELRLVYQHQSVAKAV